MDLKMTFLKSFSSIADQQRWCNRPALQSCLSYPEWKFQRSLECHQHSHQSVSQVSGSVSCPVTRNTFVSVVCFCLVTYFWPTFLSPLFCFVVVCLSWVFLKLEDTVVTFVLFYCTVRSIYWVFCLFSLFSFFCICMFVCPGSNPW